MSDRFRVVAIALQPYVTGTYALLNAADAVVALDNSIPRDLPTITTPDGSATWDWATSRWSWKHDSLVSRALANDDVMQHVVDGKKIDAIKALRATEKCLLKEAKNAVESQRVFESANSMREWGHY